MPNKKEIFTCIHCGKPFDSWVDCDRHESQDHTVMLQWTDFKPIYNSEDSMYPDYIEVPMLNGAVARYVCSTIIREPDKTEKKESLSQEKG